MKRVTFTYDSKDMKHGINGEIGEACTMTGQRKSALHSTRIAKPQPLTSCVSGQSDSAGAASICVGVGLSRAASRAYRLRTSDREGKTMSIATIILDQLGGPGFIMMTGAKNFVSDGNTLRMTLPRNASGANRLVLQAHQWPDHPHGPLD